MHRVLKLSVLCLLMTTGCSSYWQARRIEDKVDRLLRNTKRETLAQIFGANAREITAKLDDLEDKDATRMNELVESYERGNSTLEAVRGDMISVLGGTTRVVSSGKGIWVRGEDGTKLKAIGRNKAIENCQRIEVENLPEKLAKNRRFAKMTWGKGTLNGETVLFPWRLTMSRFAKEIVENTARRTAQEILRMSGDKGWSRPVHIQVITEPTGVSISHPGAEDVFVEPGEPKEE
jgi:hypothetical protein